MLFQDLPMFTELVGILPDPQVVAGPYELPTPSPRAKRSRTQDCIAGSPSDARSVRCCPADSGSVRVVVTRPPDDHPLGE